MIIKKIGIIFQTSETREISFDTPFLNKCLGVIAQQSNNTTPYSTYDCVVVDKSKFRVIVNTTMSVNTVFLAFGY